MDRSQLTKLLQSALYVRADVEVYKYMLSKGYHIIDDINSGDSLESIKSAYSYGTFSYFN